MEFVLASGLLAVLQMVFLPGFFWLRALKIPTQSRLQAAIYVFALSLITNYWIVYSLTPRHLYRAESLIAIILIECIAICAWLARADLTRTLTVSLPQWLSAAPSRQRIWIYLAFIPAIASLISFGYLCYTNIGTVFSIWDDCVSWDPWAMSWSNGSVPACGLYPQLVPANWSVTYVLVQTTYVKLFAKAIMPLFMLMSLLAYLDLFGTTRKLRWLFALTGYALVVDFFFDRLMVSSGYVEIACAFFCLLSIYSAIMTSRFSKEMSFYDLLPVVFGCGASLCKQGALYFVAWTLVWYGFRLAKKRPANWWLHVIATLAVAGMLEHFYLHLLWKSLHAKIFLHQSGGVGNLEYLSQTIHGGKTYLERLSSALQLLLTLRGDNGRLIFSAGLLLLALSAFRRGGRTLLLTIVAPFSLLWALFFSYDQRGMAMALPMIAMCWGYSVELCISKGRSIANWIAQRVLPFSRRFSSRQLWLAAATSVASSLFLFWLLKRTHHTFAFTNEPWPWWKEMCALWALPLYLGAVIAVFSWYRRKGTPVLLVVGAVVGLIFTLQNSVFDRLTIVLQQQDQLKLVCNNIVNHELYDLQSKGQIKGDVLTDYLPMRFLPQLESAYKYQDFSQPVTIESITQLTQGKKNAAYFMARSVCWPEATKDWLSKNGYTTVFDTGGYRLVALPHTGVLVSSTGQPH